MNEQVRITDTRNPANATVDFSLYVSVDRATRGITTIGISGLTELEDVHETIVTITARYDARVRPALYMLLRGERYVVGDVEIIGRRRFITFSASRTGEAVHA